MANKNNKSYKNNNSKNKNGKTQSNMKPTKKFPSNAFVMKALVVFGVIFSILGAIYLMKYFFVERSYIKINMSTDKKLEYLTINGQEELITTQKYVSDLNYSMRYDTRNVEVFKYKSQDIFKFINDEKILIVVESSKLPSNCTLSSNNYSNCTIEVDNFTEEHYIAFKGKSYKITVKTPNTSKNEEKITKRISYMLNSFEIN